MEFISSVCPSNYNNSGPEFQVVIVVDNEDGRMFPLTDDYPRCLLPVGNRRLLSYQLDMLLKSGATEIILVALREFQDKFVQFLATYTRNGLKIDLVLVDEMYGAADGIRAASDRIRSDFIYISSDVISQFCLGELVNTHRLKSADLTVMLTTHHSTDVKRDEIDREFIGLGEDNRLVMKSPKVDLDFEDEPALFVSKPLLQHCSSISLRADLVDTGICVLSKWVLELIVSNKKMTGMRTDVVPFLIKRQFQTSEYLLREIPALAHRNRPLEPLEPWLVSIATPYATVGEFKDQTSIVLDLLRSQSLRQTIATNTSGVSLMDSVASDEDQSKSGTIGNIGKSNSGPMIPDCVAQSTDLLRCFAMVYDETAKEDAAASIILTRVVDIATYLALNKEILLHKHTSNTPWDRFSNYLKKEMSVVGEGCDVSGKNVTIKQCCIGNNCTIGQMAKLNNCVVMDGVKIGENCTIQNSIICERVVIEGNCKLNECFIGSGYQMPTGSKIKNESFTSS